MPVLERIFLLILNMSITATYVALIIMVIRFLFLRRLPKVFSYSLWSILLFRLLSPVSFSSDISLANLFSPGVQRNRGALGYVPAGRLETISQLAPGNTGNGAELPLSEVWEITPGATEAAGLNTAAPATAIAAVIWITGIAVLIAFAIITYMKITSSVKTATLLTGGMVAEAKNRIGLKRAVKVYASDRIESPFVCSLFLPRMYIPSGSLNREDLSFILIHEMTHVKRFDYLIKPFSFLVLALHWFNPVMWFSFKFMGRDMEMSCDEKVMGVLGDQIRQDYSYTLLNMAAIKNRPLPGSPLAFGESNVKSRIKNILNYKKPAFYFVIIAVVLMVAAGCALLADPHTLDLAGTFTPRSIEIDFDGEMKVIYFSDEDSSQIARLLQYDTWEKAKMSSDLSTTACISGGGKVIGLYDDIDGYTFIQLLEGFDRQNGAYYRAPGEVYSNVKQFIFDHYIYNSYGVINNYLAEIESNVSFNSEDRVWIKLPDSFDEAGGGSEMGLQLKSRNELSRAGGLDFSSFLGEIVLLCRCSSQTGDDLILLVHRGEVSDWMYEGQHAIKVYDWEIIGAWKDASQRDFHLLKSALAALVSDYRLQDIEEAYFYDIYDNKIIYELTADEISALKTAFNDALETMQKPEPGWPEEAYSPGISLTIILSDQQEVNLYMAPETALFQVDYVIRTENNGLYIDSYILKSVKLQEIIDALCLNFNF